jgi:hypothetical protein
MPSETDCGRRTPYRAAGLRDADTARQLSCASLSSPHATEAVPLQVPAVVRRGAHPKMTRGITPERPRGRRSCMPVGEGPAQAVGRRRPGGAARGQGADRAHDAAARFLMMARPVPRRHWRSYGDDPLPSGEQALNEPLRAFPSWFLRIVCDRCGKERMIS